MFHRRRWRDFVHWVKRLFGYVQGFAPLFDTSPLRKLLTEKLDIAALRTSEMLFDAGYDDARDQLSDFLWVEKSGSK